jgi:hypothetical protein
MLNEILFPGNVASYEQGYATISTGTMMAFTGAGTSVPLYPTWTRLLKELIRDAGQEHLANNETLCELTEMLADDPLEVATHLEDLFTPHRFRGRLAERFAPQPNSTKCHSLVMDLPLKGAVTLNYDNGLEAAFSARRSAAPLSITAANARRYYDGGKATCLAPTNFPYYTGTALLRTPKT